MNTELVIMAAGMGSRFGGLKQIEKIGPNGEKILDFSIYDAVKSGFNRAVIVIKKEIESQFREVCGKQIEKMIDVEYVFQELDKLPAGYKVPEDRVKPWGTGHAILCAGKKITSPFAVINADDFYGYSSYKIIHDWLVANQGMCMVGYKLGNTLTENGTVARGICEVEDGILKSVTEHTALDKNSGISLDKIFPYLEKEFKKFLDTRINEPKAEFFLPSVISNRMDEEKMDVTVLNTDERWYGVTYREDINLVKSAMSKFLDEGLYDFGG